MDDNKCRFFELQPGFAFRFLSAASTAFVLYSLWLTQLIASIPEKPARASFSRPLFRLQQHHRSLSSQPLPQNEQTMSYSDRNPTRRKIPEGPKPFYRCEANKTIKQEDIKDIVMLHAPDWGQNVGVVKHFCAYEHVNFVGLGQSVELDGVDDVLEDLLAQGMISKLPVSVLISPGSSGDSVLGFAATKDKERVLKAQKESHEELQRTPRGYAAVDDSTRNKLERARRMARARARDATAKKYQVAKNKHGAIFEIWVPVSWNKPISELTDLHAQSLMDAKVKILAVHGEKDATSEASSRWLETKAGGISISFPSSNAVHNEYPKDFASAIVRSVRILGS